MGIVETCRTFLYLLWPCCFMSLNLPQLPDPRSTLRSTRPTAIEDAQHLNTAQKQSDCCIQQTNHLKARLTPPSACELRPHLRTAGTPPTTNARDDKRPPGKSSDCEMIFHPPRMLQGAKSSCRYLLSLQTRPLLGRCSVHRKRKTPMRNYMQDLTDAVMRTTARRWMGGLPQC